MDNIIIQDKRYNEFVKIFVRVGDLVICNILFILFSFRCGDTGYHELLQSLTVLSLTYFGCTLNGGIVLHIRQIHTYQIILRCLRNVVLFAIVCTLLFALGGFYRPNILLYTGYLLSIFAVITIFRLVVHYLVKRHRLMDKNLRRVILLGENEHVESMYHALSDDKALGYRVLGYFGEEENPDFPLYCTRLGTIKDVLQYLKAHQEVREIYCGLSSRYKEEVLPIIHYCEGNFVRFYTVPNIHNYMHHQMHLNLIGGVPYLSMYDEPLSRIDNRVKKRVFDIMFSLLFLCTIFPFVFILVAVITKITMPGPIFFKQKRNGLNGKEFYCWKFRSMRVNDDADKVQATKDDPRKTKWGNIMRRTNIDELPQFINVLLGNMSVVGPRPHMIKHTVEYSKLIDKYMIRHYVKPGITGWSQVNGFRGETKELQQMEGRIKGDIWYIEHWSIGLDLYIIYKTIRNAIHGEDMAY